MIARVGGGLRTIGGLGLKPRFLTISAFTTGRPLGFERWKPNPYAAVSGMSPFTMLFESKKLRSAMLGRQKWQHLNWHSVPSFGVHGFWDAPLTTEIGALEFLMKDERRLLLL